ncbi:MAG: phage replication protein [Firmicutes bacterium]|nr:phage replication protein [Bacillota bacterium]
MGHEDCGCKQSLNAIAELTREYELMEQQREFERLQYKIKRLIDNSMMGLRFQDRIFDNYNAITDQQKIALRVANNFCGRFAKDVHCKGLFFSGAVGTGKTHLAAAIANRIMKEHYIPVLFGTAPGLLNKIKHSFDDGSGDKIANMLCNVPLLIIDDLGKEYARKNADGWSWVHETLYEVINQRYENYLPLIVTTNLTLPELEKRVDKAIVSRLVEMCDGIQCNWEDYRMKKAAGAA